MNSLHNVLILLSALSSRTNAFLTTFDQTYISDLHIMQCNPDGTEPIILQNATFQIGEGNKIHVSGTAIISEDLISPIKTSVIIKKNTWFGWLKIACIDNIGSCEFEDVCSFGYPVGTECPSELDENHVPCRCPIKKGTYTLPPTTFEYFDDRSVLSGKYKGSVTVTHYNETLACYNIKGKKKWTEVLTDTPIYERLRVENCNKASKLRKNNAAEVKRKCFDENRHQSIVKKPKLREIVDVSSSEEDDMNISDLTDSNDVDWCKKIDDIVKDSKDLSDISAQSFVLVKFPTKKTCKYYVGKVLKKISNQEYKINFLRKQGNAFVFPIVEDASIVLVKDIELHLPDPNLSGGTARTSTTYRFAIDMSLYNVNYSLNIV
ncbi:hypothetical protein RN001_002755 [Aquatica leii]|uniref:Ganglioside GM2 activator n=1 Tax=Aquatica leii TaxID=1421715 RepID=A0AAN7SLZ3_9COLE|nr:hypothetical protein RN001_002755 [Aquatica leii]